MDSRLLLDVHNVLRPTHTFGACYTKIVAQAASWVVSFRCLCYSNFMEQDDVLRAGLSTGEDAAIWHPVSAERYSFNHALIQRYSLRHPI